MLFNSQLFVMGFLPLVLAAFYAAPGRQSRQAVMVIASLTFYAGWDPRFVPALVGLTLANWAVARLWAASRRDAILVAGIIGNLAVLGVCKYANFLGANLYALAGQTWAPLPIILPLGISFFTFQKISYLVDLRRRDHLPKDGHVYGLLEFAAFVTFFPQLIAGPLVRHNEMIPQFANDPRSDQRPPEVTPPEVTPSEVTRHCEPLGEAIHRSTSTAPAPNTDPSFGRVVSDVLWENLSRGALLFVIGFAKKAGIADTAATTADLVFNTAAQGDITAAAAWAGAAAYTLQILFDFSGYSDMAIGLARMFGLRIPFNFNAPYRATSLRDFWRRWHMTLSRFLRDYVYIPLGGSRTGFSIGSQTGFSIGSRTGPSHQAVNVIATMLLGGLWHGAAWTFVAWGGLHGIGLAINAAWTRAGLRMPAPLGLAITLLFVILAWVLFRAPDFATATRVYTAMLGMNGWGASASDTIRIEAPLLLAAAAAIALIGPTSQQLAFDRLRPTPWIAGLTGAALAGLLLLAGGRTPNEFIYFQF